MLTYTVFETILKTTSPELLFSKFDVDSIINIAEVYFTDKILTERETSWFISFISLLLRLNRNIDYDTKLDGYIFPSNINILTEKLFLKYGMSSIVSCLDMEKHNRRFYTNSDFMNTVVSLDKFCMFRFNNSYVKVIINRCTWLKTNEPLIWSFYESGYKLYFEQFYEICYRKFIPFERIIEALKLFSCKKLETDIKLYGTSYILGDLAKERKLEILCMNDETQNVDILLSSLLTNPLQIQKNITKRNKINRINFIATQCIPIRSIQISVPNISEYFPFMIQRYIENGCLYEKINESTYPICKTTALNFLSCPYKSLPVCKGKMILPIDFQREIKIKTLISLDKIYNINGDLDFLYQVYDYTKNMIICNYDMSLKNRLLKYIKMLIVQIEQFNVCITSEIKRYDPICSNVELRCVVNIINDKISIMRKNAPIMKKTHLQIRKPTITDIKILNNYKVNALKALPRKNNVTTIINMINKNMVDNILYATSLFIVSSIKPVYKELYILNYYISRLKLRFP